MTKERILKGKGLLKKDTKFSKSYIDKALTKTQREDQMKKRWEKKERENKEKEDNKEKGQNEIGIDADNPKNGARKTFGGRNTVGNGGRKN